MQWDTRPPWPLLGFRGWAEEVHICAVLPRPLLLLLGAVLFRLLPECSLLTCSDLALGEPVITLHGVIWTVEQGRYEGMGEPVITLHGVIWTVEQGRSEGRNRSSAIWCSVLCFFTAPSCEHLWGRPINGRCARAFMCACVVFRCDVALCVCVVCGCVGP